MNIRLSINISTSYLHIQRKGRNSRNESIEATQKTIEPIYSYLTERCPEDEKESVFISYSRYSKRLPLSTTAIGKIVTKRMKIAGIYQKDKTAHSLRHTAAVHAIKFRIKWKFRADPK